MAERHVPEAAWPESAGATVQRRDFEAGEFEGLAPGTVDPITREPFAAGDDIALVGGAYYHTASLVAAAQHGNQKLADGSRMSDNAEAIQEQVTAAQWEIIEEGIQQPPPVADNIDFEDLELDDGNMPPAPPPSPVTSDDET